jgi:hypothetical protein
MDKRKAVHRIAGRSETDISPSDRSRFIEVVETELSNLHEGNFTRYGLRPLEFADWKKVWR